MRLIKPSFQIIKPTGYTIDDIYKSIELAGRVSYKSEDRITEDSAKGFVDRMMKMKHLSTCEFGTIYLKVPAGKHKFLDNDYFNECNDIKDSFYSNPYTKIHGQEGYHYISTNYRVLLENFSKEFISELLQYLCEPTEFHSKRVCVKFTCDRGISHELVRHRAFSFMQESSRYCNYSLGKFNNELTFIKPCFFDDNKLALYGPYHTVVRDKSPESIFIAGLNNAERDYIDLIKLGWKPEQARAVLPNAIKTELFMCGFIEDWKKFFLLRTPTNAHPQMRELTIPLQEEFIYRNYIK